MAGIDKRLTAHEHTVGEQEGEGRWRDAAVRAERTDANDTPRGVQSISGSRREWYCASPHGTMEHPPLRTACQLAHSTSTARSHHGCCGRFWEGDGTRWVEFRCGCMWTWMWMLICRPHTKCCPFSSSQRLITSSDKIAAPSAPQTQRVPLAATKAARCGQSVLTTGCSQRLR